MSAPPVAKLSLSTKQGPPLWIPLSFFLSAPVAIAAAGVMLLVRADDGIVTSFAPSNVGLVHLGALGFLLLIIVGSFYQLLPVVAGALVPWIRAAHVVHGLLFAGAGVLVAAQWRLSSFGFGLAAALLSLGLVLWLVPSTYALVRSRVSHPTVWGLRLAVAAAISVAALGVRMALSRAGLPYSGDFLTFRMAHATIGLLVFVGGLMASVSWQVVPMFFLTAVPPRWLPRAVLSGVAASLTGLLIVALSDLATWTVAVAATPAAVAVWVLQPIWLVRALRARKRRRKDATLLGWWISSALSPVCLVVGAVAAVSSHPTPPVVFGLLVLWGQAGMLVHAMLTRIAPFLVYLHLSAPLIATHRMRSAKELLPDPEVRNGAILHGVTLAVGLVAAGLGSMMAWRVFGGGLVCVAAYVAYELLATWKRGRTPISVRTAR